MNEPTENAVSVLRDARKLCAHRQDMAQYLKDDEFLRRDYGALAHYFGHMISMMEHLGSMEGALIASEYFWFPAVELACIMLGKEIEGFWVEAV